MLEPGMLSKKQTTLVLAGAAVLATGIAQASFGGPAPQKAAVLNESSIAGKGDRAPVVQTGPAERHVVTTVELVGVGNAMVILRDQSGAILFKSDPARNTTYLARNTELPVVTIKEEQASVLARKAVVHQEQRKETSDQPRKSRSSVGCITALSPLVKTEVSSAKTPSLCLA
jgi:hypothetical protein